MVSYLLKSLRAFSQTSVIWRHTEFSSLVCTQRRSREDEISSRASSCVPARLSPRNPECTASQSIVTLLSAGTEDTPRCTIVAADDVRDRSEVWHSCSCWGASARLHRAKAKTPDAKIRSEWTCATLLCLKHETESCVLVEAKIIAPFLLCGQMSNMSSPSSTSKSGLCTCG